MKLRSRRGIRQHRWKPARITPENGLVIDAFAGGGGASTGVAAALGRDPDIAINHDKTAMKVYKANHPNTLVMPEDIWTTRPRDVTKGRPVFLFWGSPDCTHHSIARGGKPKEKGIRALAHVIVDWAREVMPRIIVVENVREFQEWGPLHEQGQVLAEDVFWGKGKKRRLAYPAGTVLGEGHPLINTPIGSRKGETFWQWVGKLELLGYVVEWKVLDASAFGAPTRRRRLFIIARCDGEPITWPAPTHGAAPLLPVHTAAECIDWSLPCPSIFERKKPLAEKTLWRIAKGIEKFVLNNPTPFVIGCGGRAGQTPPTSASSPMGTVTAKNDRALVVPSLVKVNHGGEDARGESLKAPLSTVTAQRRGHALVTPVMVTFDNGSNSRGERRADEPLSTTTTENRHAVVIPALVQTGYGERKGQAARTLDIEAPLGTVMATGQKHALVAAFLLKHFGGHMTPGSPLDAPVDTITARDHHALAAVTLAKFRGTAPDQQGAGPVTEPMPTITAGGIHVAEVRAFLVKYYGSGGQHTAVDEPLATITAKHRMGLVVVHGVEYQIVDIGMRMLEPEELLRAQFGRFAPGYDLSAAPSKAGKVKLIGNSVCPEMSEVIVRANIRRTPAKKAA